MRRREIWTLPPHPLWINISGPRCSGKRETALELARRLLLRTDVRSIALFFPGNLARAAAEALLGAFSRNVIEKWPDEHLDENIRRLSNDQNTLGAPHIPSGAVIYATSLADLPSYLAPSPVEQTEAVIARLLDLELVVSSISRRSRYLRRRRQAIREQLEARADVIISTHPGHMPKAPFSFYIMLTPKQRRKKHPVPDVAKPLIDLEDKRHLVRLALHHEVVEDEPTLRYDPAARLTRYPGHFLPVWPTTRRMPWRLLCDYSQFAISEHRERTRLQEQLLGFFQTDRVTNHPPTGTLSILMLKGGGPGSLYGSINSAILRRLTKDGTFQVCLGFSRPVSLGDALRRWDDFVEKRIAAIHKFYRDKGRDAPLHVGLPPMPRGLEELLEDLQYGLQTLDHWRVQAWLAKLRELRIQEAERLPLPCRTDLARIVVFLDYVLAPSQYILLRRVAARETLLHRWEIGWTDLQTVSQKKVGGIPRPRLPKDPRPRPAGRLWTTPTRAQIAVLKRWLTSLDEQEFVKLILVGDMNQPHCLRNLVWNLVRTRPVPWTGDYFQRDLSVEKVAQIVNGVHGPMGPRTRSELQREVMILSTEDIIRFSAFLASMAKPPRR